MLKNKFLATGVVVFLCASAVLAARLSRPGPEEILRRSFAERATGDPQAPVSIVEYFDYQCPPCALAHEMLDEAIKKHPGKIRLEVRYMPWPAHQNALKAATYADCLSRQKGKFWPFSDLVFDHQQEWAHDPYADVRFVSYAGSVGADLRALDGCVKDPATEKTILDEKEKGLALGIQTTPSFYINGQLVVGNDGLKAELDKLEAPSPAVS